MRVSLARLRRPADDQVVVHHVGRSPVAARGMLLPLAQLEDHLVVEHVTLSGDDGWIAQVVEPLLPLPVHSSGRCSPMRWSGGWCHEHHLPLERCRRGHPGTGECPRYGEGLVADDDQVVAE